MSNWKWIDQENKDHIALWAVSVVAIREVSAVLTIRLPVRYYWVRFSSQADLKEFANWLSYLTLLCAFLIFGESVSEHLNRKISCLHKSNRQQEIIAGSPRLLPFSSPGATLGLSNHQRGSTTVVYAQEFVDHFVSSLSSVSFPAIPECAGIHC